MRRSGDFGDSVRSSGSEIQRLLVDRGWVDFDWVGYLWSGQCLTEIQKGVVELVRCVQRILGCSFKKRKDWNTGPSVLGSLSEGRDSPFLLSRTTFEYPIV